jgi:hypothetical protein
VVHVIDPTTPASVKYDIFKRINTGGTPLNNQEIRHCMSRPRSRDFLKRCTHLEEFHLATGGGLRDHIRMDDREVVLRFCAFALDRVDGYLRVGAMDAFLETTTSKLDDPSQVSDERLDQLESDFSSAMTSAYEVFGTHAFRKWPLSSERNNPINRPLFECWSVVLMQFDIRDLKKRKERIVTAARTLMSSDREYIDAITSSTGDPHRVRRRFQLTEQAARAGL